MTKEEALNAWKALGKNIQNVAVRMSEEADPRDASGENSIVKLWAIALLCRSTNNFAGMQLLLGDALIVEARTIVRCIYENLFRVGYLVSKGYEAVKTWLLDHDAANKVVGKELQEWAEDHEVEEVEEFARFMADLNGKKIPKSGMQTQATAAGLREHYITYRMLSADAAHPTARVLARHAREESNGALTISGASLWTDDDEELETRALACLAFLFICLGVNKLVGLGYQTVLEQLSTECSKLYAETLTHPS